MRAVVRHSSSISTGKHKRVQGYAILRNHVLQIFFLVHRSSGQGAAHQPHPIAEVARFLLPSSLSAFLTMTEETNHAYS